MSIQKNDFIYGQVLGEGSFGQVRLCVHKKTNTQYAAKILIKEELIKAKQVLFNQKKFISNRPIT